MPATAVPATSTSRADRRCWTLVQDSDRLDVEVVAPDEATVGDVVQALAPLLPASAGGLWSGSRRLPPDLPLTADELGHGAVIGMGAAPAQAGPAGAPSALELHVVGGPDAGRTVPVQQGRQVLGRGPDSVLVLHDPGVSRRHVELRVSAGTVVVTDLGSANGSLLADQELGVGPAAWPQGTRLRLGATTLAVAGPDTVPAALAEGTGGRTRVRTPVRIPVGSAPVEVAFPAPPAPPPPRRTTWLAVLLPAAGGGVLAWVLGVPTFLFFALLGPVVAAAGWWSERRSGRRTHRRELAEHERRRAVAQESLGTAVHDAVLDLHRRCPDVAALVAAARRRTALLWSRRAADTDALVVRLGTARGPTGVLRREPDGSRVPQEAPSVPVEVDLRRGGLALVGPRHRTTGVLRSVVGQLAALHAPDVLELLVVTTGPGLRDWRWMRWLPHLAPGGVTVLEPPAGAGDEDSAARALLRRLDVLVDRRRRSSRAASDPAWRGAWSVVVVDGAVPVALASALRDAPAVGVLVVTHATTTPGLPVATCTAAEVSEETGCHAVVRSTGAPERREVVLDQLPEDVARDLGRDLAGLAPADRAGTVPTEVRTLDLPGPGPRPDAAGHLTGPWSRARDALVAPLGAGADGPVLLDLCRSGPHALVAGTTGSGKSELLQTLITGLALSHPPDRCSFLLVDYKGGAAFAEAAALPHTVGLLTDLDGAGTARALRSLTAELVRREAVLAEHGVADVAALPGSVPLARLVIVVDEFATLAEELPAFVPGLVGIAQRGRSLGVHLVLATQRPAGVVSPEIRANCTLRICLRTTDESDSRDVLGGPEAAHLPVGTPGRAFLRAGSGEPVLFQGGRVSQPWRSAEDLRVQVRPWPWPVPPLVAGGPPREAPQPSDLAVVAPALRAHADRIGVRAPHRPWCPPLPDRLEPAWLATADAEDGDLVLGLVDRPDEQAQRPLTLDLDDGGTWLAVGGPRSGRTTLLRSVLRQAVSRRGPDRLHVHVIDLGGGTLAAEASHLTQVGTVVGAPDAHRLVRLVDRLLQEVDDRRRGGRSSPAPGILLLLDGAEALCTLLDEADPAAGSPALLRLLRDGAAAGLTGVVTADRAIPGGRLAAVAARRLVLPLADRADYAVAGVPLHAVPSARPPGRALLGEEALECQLVLPPRVAAPGRTAACPASAGPPPLRVVELPADPGLGGHQDRIASAAALSVVLGPGGDEGSDLSVDLLRTGGLLVLGPAGSGRRSTIEALVGDLQAAQVPVLDLRPASRGGPTAPGSRRADATDPAAVAAWLATVPGRPAVVVADDLGSPAHAPALTALPAPGADSGVVLLAGGHGGSLATWFQGPVAALRRTRSGLLLVPGPGDAEVLGTRLPRTPVPCRPGSGWLVVDGVPERVQVARRRAQPDDRPQVSSSSGPISCVAYQASS